MSLSSKRLLRVEQKIAVAHDEVYAVYLTLLPDDDLLALLDNMNLCRGTYVAPGIPGWLAVPPQWVVRPDLWRQAAVSVGGYTDQELVDASAELVESIESRATQESSK